MVAERRSTPTGPLTSETVSSQGVAASPATGARRGASRSRSKALHHAPDPDARPEGLPAPWSALPWRPLATARNATKSNVFVSEHEGRLVVCKDASRVTRRWILGRFRRWTLRNEVRALQRMAGLPGTPGLLAAWESGLIMEHVPGRLLTELRGTEVPEAVFDRLDALVDAIHARGITVGDLHRRNILVDSDGRVGIIDFELALDTGAGLGRRLGRARLEGFDDLAAARQRERFGAPLLPRHEQILEHPPFPYRIGRRLKRWRSQLLRR
jgi:predicted Ser/Thr protein kinase